MAAEELTLTDIRAAHRRIRDYIHETPVFTSATLNAAHGARLFFKCENLQKTGAFKARGASNAVLMLEPEHAARGVVTHSSGNHAAALARAASLRKIEAHIVMPRTAPQAKQAAVRRYGGHVVFCEPTQVAREAAAAELQARTGATLVHPYNDVRVMAGQGTTALEFLRQVPELDAIICPLGGGGHLSGIAVAAKALKPAIRIIGAEPAGADDAARSLAAGRITPCATPRSIADGLLATLGERCFPLIRRHVDEIVTVEEVAIVEAMRTLWQVMKLVVEPSGAVGLAAVPRALAHFGRAGDSAGSAAGHADPARTAAAGTRAPHVGVVLSGGNLDLDRLPWQESPRGRCT